MRLKISTAVLPESAEKLPSCWATITADLGDGMKTHLCAAHRTAGVEEAASILTAIDLFLLNNPSEREAGIFLNGIGVGRLLEMIDVLPFEPAVAQEKKRRSGHQEKFGTDKAEKQERAMATYNSLRKKDPRAKKQVLVQLVAKQLGCSEKSAWNYLKVSP